MKMMFLEEVVALSARGKVREVPRELTVGSPVMEGEVIATLHYQEELTGRSMVKEWLEYLLESQPGGTA